MIESRVWDEMVSYPWSDDMKAEDMKQDHYDSIANELESFEVPDSVEEDGPVYYGCLESLRHEELIYKYQQLTAEFERFAHVRN